MRKLIGGLKGFGRCHFSNLKKLKIFQNFFKSVLCPKSVYCERCETRINLKGAKINQWPPRISSMPFLAIWKRWNCSRLFWILFLCKKKFYCQKCEKRITWKGAEISRWPRGISSMPFYAVWKSWNFYPDLFESFLRKKGFIVKVVKKESL